MVMIWEIEIIKIYKRWWSEQFIKIDDLSDKDPYDLGTVMIRTIEIIKVCLKMMIWAIQILKIYERWRSDRLRSVGSFNGDDLSEWDP